MPQTLIKEDMKLVVIHDGGAIGQRWKEFVEDLFTVDLPEEYRDLGLDVTSESILDLSEDAINNILSCNWRIFIFSQAMLQVVKDHSSPLSSSGLLDTDANKNIILILGGEKDNPFVKETRNALHVFSDFAAFHLVQATSTETIFNHIIAIVSPLSIVLHPNILSTEDQDQYISLIGNKAYPSSDEGRYFVQFKNNEDVLEVEANLFNPCTLVLENPGHSPGVVEVIVYFCPNGDPSNSSLREQLCEPVQATFQSELDKLQSILENVVNPFNFLCQALNVKAKDSKATEAIDKVLTKSFQKQIPKDQLARVFGTDLGVENQDDSARNEYVPTLLHFAALHGLRDLTALLLRCPGSVHAFGTQNCDGDFPTNLAEKAGHWDLKDYMNCYMELSALVDSEVGNTHNTSEMMSSIVTGQFYLSFSGNEAESIYESITSAQGAGHSQMPGYLRMKPLQDSELPCYDSPFIVPIPVADESAEYESMLKQMIENDETYMTLTNSSNQSSNLFPSSDHGIPPNPPPKDTKSHEMSAGVYQASNQSRLGADRISYVDLEIPKLMPYISPAQQELISLQQKVKNGELSTNQAVLRFKEWERKHKEQAASFQFQQECLQRIRQSLMKSKELKRIRGENDEIKITAPVNSGSSTYDFVLRKARDKEAKEVTYGAVRPQTDVSNTARTSGINQEPSTFTQSRGFGNHRFSRMSSKGKLRYSRSSDSDQHTVQSHPNIRPNPPRSTVRFPPPVPPRDPEDFSDAPVVPPRIPL